MNIMLFLVLCRRKGFGYNAKRKSIMKRRQIMSKVTTPFKYDFVGSFLRPQALKDAKAAYQDGKISKDELDKVVNEEITKVVAKQKELGFHVITDGEFRRTFWHLDFMWGV
jgi:methionine synthase II (cobalamin-independent)